MNFKISFIILFLLFSGKCFAQFNNVYLNDGTSTGSAIGIKENSLTGEFYMPLGYSLDTETSSRGFLKINPDGALNELKHQTDFESGNLFYIWNRGFFATADGGYVLAGNGAGSDIIRLDNNLDEVWELDEIQDLELVCWGGGELGNGDLIFGYTGDAIPYNQLLLTRYSGVGELLNNFQVELDYNFGYPTTFLIQDSLVFISFARLQIGAHRRNYLVCYNALTGQELWETHQIENGEALGFTDGFMCLTTDGQLKIVYVEQTGPNNPGMFDSGWLGYFKVVNIEAQTGQMFNESTLSELELQSYVLDAAPTDDGGLVFLFWAINPENETSASFGIMKLDSDMNLEWRRHYIQPIDLKAGENASHLIELETTSDDCIVAVGDAAGSNSIEGWSFRYPWVLKVDACGNEMVTDCTLSGVGDLALNNSIAIYPNPARDRIYLKGKNTIKHVSIYDLQGKMVHDESFSGSLEQTLFIDHLPPGLYLVQATNQTGAISKCKVSVKR